MQRRRLTGRASPAERHAPRSRVDARGWGRPLLVAIAAIVAACSSEPSPPTGAGGSGTGGGGGPSCTGTPVPCEERTGLDCDKQLGCSDHGACIGQGVPCDGFLKEGDCTFHFGCTWKTGETTCTGGPSCPDFNDEMTCLMTPGCAWTTSKTGCEGTTDACADFADEILCATQQGCGWKAEACTGSPPIACETFSSQSGCEVQPGCSWK